MRFLVAVLIDAEYFNMPHCAFCEKIGEPKVHYYWVGGRMEVLGRKSSCFGVIPLQ